MRLSPPLFLRAYFMDEFLEARELLLDEVDGRLILELELVVELGVRETNEDLRPQEDVCLEEHEHLTPLVLHAATSERPRGCGLDRHRFVLERLILGPRHPVDRIL